VLGQVATKMPVMVDTDGERPEAIGALKTWLKLVQVTLEVSANPRPLDRPLETLGEAAAAGCDHALVLVARDDTSDGQLIRIVEQAHGASAGTMIVVHPGPAGDRPTLDRRWATLIEQAIAIHGDTRLHCDRPVSTGVQQKQRGRGFGRSPKTRLQELTVAANCIVVVPSLAVYCS
jgi:hypothetical protein